MWRCFAAFERMRRWSRAAATLRRVCGVRIEENNLGRIAADQLRGLCLELCRRSEPLYGTVVPTWPLVVLTSELLMTPLAFTSSRKLDKVTGAPT